MPHTKASKHTRRSSINVSSHENSGIAHKKPRIIHRVSFLENHMENVRFSERQRIVSDSRVITCDSRISQYLELVNNVRTYLNVLLNVIGNMLKESQLSQMLHVEGVIPQNISFVMVRSLTLRAGLNFWRHCTSKWK